MTHSQRRRTVLVSSLALAAAIALTGCSAGVNGAASGASNVPLPAGIAPDLISPESVAFDMAVNPADADRSIIVTGWATILVDDPRAAAEAAVAIVDEAGGRVDARSLQAPTDYSAGSATLTLRVPADSLDDVLTSLSELGRVQTVSTNA